MVDAAVLREVLSLSDGESVEVTSTHPTLASPSWWGGDSERFIATVHDEGASKNHFVKVMNPGTASYIDWRASFEFAAAAGARGVGPSVVGWDSSAGVLIMEDLSHDTATATVDVFDDDGIEALVTARKQVAAFPGHWPSKSVFDEISRLRELLKDDEQAMPSDLEWMLRRLDPAIERITATGYDSVPCHGDGNASNVLVASATGDYALVDWDCAGLMDPLQDLGVLLQELRPDDRAARPVFELYWGSWDASAFDRARVYGLADCIRWGLIGLYSDLANPGKQEYSKFADWQFFRARLGLSDSSFSARVLNL